MAIQLRRGAYIDFDPSKLLPGEVGVVQSGDTHSSDGKSAYIAFSSGDVKRIATEDDVQELDDRIDDIEYGLESAEELITSVSNKANSNENRIAEVNTEINKIKIDLQNVSIDPDDLGLYQDADTGYVYPTYKNIVSENGIPLASSGGGGGGGSTTDAVFTASNTTGWLSKTIASGSDCVVSLTWSSIENELPTGNGSIRITVNDIVKSAYEVAQGSVSVNLKQYLTTGTNKVKIRLADVYDQGKTFTFTITAVELSISSSFDPSIPQEGIISVPYTPVGAIEKTIHFVLDNTELDTVSTSASGRQLTYTIASQSHGAHVLVIYFTATINGETVTSNVLRYEFMAVSGSSITPIITSQYNESSASQFSTIQIPYQVYTPNSLTSSVGIYVNNVLQTTLTVDRTEQTYVYRADTAGALAIKFQTGNVNKTINITITESDIDVEAETENLALYLSSYGRSNQEANPGTWTYGTGASQISATMTNFNFTSDGWQADSDGITVLRVSGSARVTIPYKPFAEDFRTSGKTIEIEFATRNVLNYDSVIMSCFSGDRGFKLTAQKALLKSEQSEISIQYKEDDHIRVAFVAEKRSKNRLLYVFINGIPSGVVQYPDNDDFSQVSPVNISIGSNDCTIDLYCIRIYDNDLTKNQILDNWIADTQNGITMYERYLRNNIYDDYGGIVISKLPSDLPYFILSAEELPQYKGDKKTIYGSYVDPLHPSKSFTFTGCQINVQGTSSAPYARKNYDMQFKQGFVMTATGETADKYALRDGAIPFNRFVLKADVASSEGANNVELVRLYNDACPYKTAEMIADSRVRWGIDGFPIVVFWNNLTTGNTSFLGKYNFNLPKRAPAPYGYDKDDTLESWEFENNTSSLLLFKSDYFDQTTYITDEGDVLPNWRKDFEARFPSDAWLDIDNLQELCSFVVSTDRTQATGNALPQSVTYDGVTYTTDSSAYRLAKFKAEFPSYAELDTFLFYYIFTELFLMVDSRAKNLFIGFNGSNTASGHVAPRKAVAQPYDMDTGLGTNNEGSLVFGYSLEDTDHLTGGVNIFNGQDSVLWNNLRDAFSANIVQMYQSLRANGTISYNSVEQRYEAHQIKWPEAIWIEDSWFKYIDPLINPDPGKEATGVYLPMMQGSKEEQRKWWLINRFKYMDSKWNAGEALSQVIQLRGYAKANITVTPYADIYPSVKYGSYLVQARGSHGTPTTLVCPLDSVNDTEIYIYSAPQLASVGDLSGLKVGFADFSMATRLQSIKLGDSDSNYDNPNLTVLTLGSNVLLQTIDCRNCSSLGTGDQKYVDLSGCEIIENVYFGGTAITGITLPNGGELKVLSLPDTITSLVIRNQSGITTFSIEGNDYSAITTLRIENCSNVIPVLDILEDMPANSRVRIIGFTMTVQSTTDVEDFFDYLDTMRGLDEQGNNLDHAVVAGTITGLGTITGEWLAQMNARYPNVNIEYEHITSKLYYYNGETLYYTETITDGGNGTYSGTPTKSSTAQYTYAFAGWSKDSDDNTVDADARTAVTADRNIYACYTATVRTYTVTWKNADGTTLETDNNVPYGSTPQYNESTPTYQGQTSTGWNPTPSSVTGNVTYTATYLPVYTVNFYNQAGTTVLQTVSVVQGGTATYTGTTPTNDEGTEFLGWSTSTDSSSTDANLTNIQANTNFYAAHVATFVEEEITDTWDQIIANIDNGTYSTKYKIGNYKPIDLGDEGTINMQIVAMNTDELADGSGYAPLTFIGKELLKEKRTSAKYSGTIWSNSLIRKYINGQLFMMLQKNNGNVGARINIVKKIQSAGTNVTDTTYDTLWIPSTKEVYDKDYTEEASGIMYSLLRNHKNLRIKTRYNQTTSEAWILRSIYNPTYYGNYRYPAVIDSNGSESYVQGDTSSCVCLGFCLGHEHRLLSDDSWSTILSRTEPWKYYYIGDTKELDLGTEGKHLMQIVAFNTDSLASGNGKAKITWISKDLLNTAKPFNSTQKTVDGETGYNVGGWEYSDLRDFLKTTVKPLIPEVVKNSIVEVTKEQTISVNGTEQTNGQTTVDDVWIPSISEIYTISYDKHYDVFYNAETRIKQQLSKSKSWWSRDARRGTTEAKFISTSGASNYSVATNNLGVALGFCTN